MESRSIGDMAWDITVLYRASKMLYRASKSFLTSQDFMTIIRHSAVKHLELKVQFTYPEKNCEATNCWITISQRQSPGSSLHNVRPSFWIPHACLPSILSAVLRDTQDWLQSTSAAHLHPCTQRHDWRWLYFHCFGNLSRGQHCFLSGEPGKLIFHVQTVVYTYQIVPPLPPPFFSTLHSLQLQFDQHENSSICNGRPSNLWLHWQRQCLKEWKACC